MIEVEISRVCASKLKLLKWKLLVVMVICCCFFNDFQFICCCCLALRILLVRFQFVWYVCLNTPRSVSRAFEKKIVETAFYEKHHFQF